MNSILRGGTLTWLAVASFASGCGTGARPAPELAPPDLETARAAVVASLEEWKADRRVSGVLIRSSPKIGVVDSGRADRKMLAYQVVGPLMTIGKARPFAVQLTLADPRETVNARYLVIGRDPLWVFRQEDFDRMLHWEHKMDPPPAAAPVPPAAPTQPTAPSTLQPTVER